MVFTSHQLDSANKALGAGSSARRAGDNLPNFLRHLRDAISSWSDADDEAGAAALMARSGGRLTDSVEREMFERRAHSNWSVDA